VAVGDSFRALAHTTLVVPAPGVLLNDFDVDSPPIPGLMSLTAVLDSPPANGSLTLSPDGSFTYTPNAGVTSPDSFSYRTRDPSGAESLPAVVTINIDAPPVAVDDSLTLKQNSFGFVFVIGNDFDPDGFADLDPFSVAITQPP